jgi:hypothetical protein
VNPGSCRPLLYRIGGLALPLLLTACITEGPSPPRVDVPEPGAAPRAGNAGATRRPATRAYPATTTARAATQPRVYPAYPAGGARPGVPVGESGGITVQSSTESGADAGSADGYPMAGAASEPASDAEGYPAPDSAMPVVGAAPGYPDAGADPAAAAEPPVAAAAGVAIGADHVPARSSNNAVNALLASADGARRKGDLDAAVAAAERALRIEPGDPAVYYELALLRLARGERDLAGQLARKGLAQGPEPELRQRLEDVLAQATRASG